MSKFPIPANTEAEQGVLSCILYQPRNLARVVDTVMPEHFHEERHRHIYSAIKSLHGAGKDITIFTIKAELQRERVLDEIGGQSYLDELQVSFLSHERIEHYADIVRSTSVYRRLYDLAAVIAEEALHQREGALDRIQERLEGIARDTDIKEAATLDEALDRYIMVLDKRREAHKAGKSAGVSTGFRDLDKILTGLKPSRLYVLAARPSVGKTALSLNISTSIIKQAKHVFFVSLEMEEGELMQRILSAETPVDQSLLDTGDITEDEIARIKAVREQMRGRELHIEDQVYSLPAIVAQAKAIHRKKKLDLIVIDYLQIMDVPKEERNQQRYQEVGKITTALKRLAKDLKAPVLLLAQLSRKSEDHSVPQLSDLYESARIEQDADVVMLAHVEQLEEAKREHCEPYAVNILVRKHRNGRIGQASLLLRPRLVKFDNLVEEDHEPARY